MIDIPFDPALVVPAFEILRELSVVPSRPKASWFLAEGRREATHLLLARGLLADVRDRDLRGPGPRHFDLTPLGHQVADRLIGFRLPTGEVDWGLVRADPWR